MDDLLAEGLKSKDRLVEEGKMEPSGVKGLFYNQSFDIYFQWVPPHLEANKKDCDWVSIKVNPDSTSVFNMEFRFKIESRNYNNSKMSLADYISQHEKTEEMRQGLEQGKAIVWDPLKAEPTIVKAGDKRFHDSTWQYSNEILIPRDIIPASEFSGYHKAKKELSSIL